jgi:uncharacterized protein (TIGR03437 family)
MALLMASLHARNVFLIPNTTGTLQTINVYSADTFLPVGTISNVANVSQAISTPAGDKVYLITKSTTPAVIVVSGTSFTPTGKTFSFNGIPTAAAISPDGRRLIVLADTVHVIDTTTDTELPNSFSVATASTFADVVISPDSTRAYILTRPFSGSSSQISILDLTTNALAAGVSPFTLPGSATTVSVGPNGLVYATAQSNFYELEPRTLTLRFNLALSGNPGKPAFTSDGLGAIVPVQNFTTGTQLAIIDLTKRLSFPVSLPGLGNVPLDSLVLGNSGHIYAFSSSTSTVYDITPSTGGFSQATFGILTLPGTVLSVATSKEATPRLLFLNTATSIYRVDLNLTQVTGTQPATAGTGNLTYTGAAPTGSPTQLVVLNNNESAAVNTQFVPVIVRALDANGLPLANVPITFSTASGAILSPPNTLTNAAGYAVTNVTAPGTVGTITVSASAPGSGATAVNTTLNVVQSTPGGGGPGGSGGLLTIVTGNGQAIREQFPSSEELVVRVNDVNGNPLPGAPVSFTIMSGSGGLRPGELSSLTPSCAGGGPTLSCTSNAQGEVRAIFLATNLPQGISFDTTTIAATSGNTTVTFNEVTYLSALQGQTLPGPSVGEIKPGFGDRSITGRVGQLIPGAIQVRVVASGGAQLGFPIPGVGLRVITDNPDVRADCVGGTVLTDFNGVANCDLVLSGKPGTAILSAIVGSGNVRPAIVLTVTAGAPATLNIVSGNNQSGNVGTQLTQPLTVQVLDQFGTPLSDTTVTFAPATAGTVTVSAASVQTNAQGNASVNATLGNTPGAASVVARVGNNLSATFNITVNPTFGAITAVSGGGQAAATNAAFTNPLVVRVTNTAGQPLANAPVSFAVSSGSATLSRTSATTDANGNASVNATAGGNIGPVVVTATAGTFSTTFNLTVRPPLFITTVVNGANFFPGLAPGAIATIIGTGIAGGNTGVVLPTNVVGPLPTSLGGVSVTINGVPAPMFSVSNVNGQEQINVQVPFQTAPGQPAAVAVTTSAGTAQINNVSVQAVQPAIFENLDAANNRFAVAQRLTDGAYITPTNPVQRGQRVRVYLTGLGQTTPAAVTNQGGIAGQRVLAPVIVGINNEGVPFESAEYLPGANGVYMVTFTVPTNAPTGPYVPLSFGAIAPDGTVQYSQGSTISIQ